NDPLPLPAPPPGALSRMASPKKGTLARKLPSCPYCSRPPSTCWRNPALPPQASARYADRSPGSAMARAASKMSRSRMTPYSFGLPVRYCPTVRIPGAPSAKKVRDIPTPARRASVLNLFQPFEQERPGVAPDAVRGPGRHPQCLGRLFRGEAGEEAEFDQLRRLRVRGGQVVQRLVHREDVLVRPWRHETRFVDR